MVRCVVLRLAQYITFLVVVQCLCMEVGISPPEQARQIGAPPKEHRDDVAEGVIFGVCEGDGGIEKPIETANSLRLSFEEH